MKEENRGKGIGSKVCWPSHKDDALYYAIHGKEIPPLLSKDEWLKHNEGNKND